MLNQKTNWKFILIILILSAIVGGGILGYLRYFEKETKSFTKFPEIKKPEKVVEKQEKPKIEEETANWNTYRSEEYGFETKYPSSKVCDYSPLKPEANVFCREFSLPTKEQYQKYGYKIQFGVDILGEEELRELVEYLKNWAKGKMTFNGIKFDFYEDDGVLVGTESWAPLYYYITEIKGENKKIVFWIEGFYRAKYCEQCLKKETLRSILNEVYAAGPVGEHCEKCKGDLLMEKVERETIDKMLSTFRFLK